MAPMDTPTPLPSAYQPYPDISDRSRGVALVLGGLLGIFGAHRFYVGRRRTGVLMALTLGGCGLWFLYDVVLLAAGEFRDAEGRAVVEWAPGHASHGLRHDDLLAEVDALRAEVTELSERVAFTERLLANPREPETPRAG